MIVSGAERLKKVRPDLVALIQRVALTWDVAILETDRSVDRQAELVATGKSQTMESKHLIQADGFAHAVDLAPLPVDWNDLPRWYYFGGFILGTAKEMEIRARWGGDWNGNTQVKDQTFQDLDHIEIA